MLHSILQVILPAFRDLPHTSGVSRLSAGSSEIELVKCSEYAAHGYALRVCSFVQVLLDVHVPAVSECVP